jgi:hypothetical protein
MKIVMDKTLASALARLKNIYLKKTRAVDAVSSKH